MLTITLNTKQYRHEDQYQSECDSRSFVDFTCLGLRVKNKDCLRG